MITQWKEKEKITYFFNFFEFIQQYKKSCDNFTINPNSIFKFWKICNPCQFRT